jgi:hypothetical protein
MSEVNLSEVPGAIATDPERRAWLHALFSIPSGFNIGEPVRFGGSSQTPLAIPILGPDGRIAATVRFERESEASSAKDLRHALARDANLRGATITSAKVAGDAYYVLCSLARVVGRGDPLGEASEWIDEYLRAAVALEGHELGRRGGFKALEALRAWPYSKRVIGLYLHAVERGQGNGLEPPRPPLLVDARTGRGWTSARHLGTFVRHDLDAIGAVRDGELVGRALEVGCERLDLSLWDRSDRRRSKRIGMVLVGFPEAIEPPVEDEIEEGA